MRNRISKSDFKAQAFKYFRHVQRTHKALIITERGQPVLRIVPYLADYKEALQALRGSVLKYERPTAAVGLADWEPLK